jgi:PEP-CTERM/exosortase A-associated glycosyltransferase
MQSVPNVLHILDHSWPVLSGYSVRSRNLLTSQYRIGASIKALTSPLHELDDPSSTDVTLDGVQYIRTPVHGRWAKAALRRRWPIARERGVVRLLRDRILAVLRREPVALLYAHSPALCGLAALQAARRAGLPCVYEIRAFWEDAAERNGNGSQSLRSRLTNTLETYVAQRAEAVAAISKPMLADLEARGIDPQKLFHVPNGVDTDRFIPVARDEVLAAELKLGDATVFGFLGSLYRYEGVSWMIRAASRLRRRGHKFHLLVVGRGEDESDVRQAILDTDASDYVHQIPHVPHDQIDRYYSVVDIVVCPRLSRRLTELVTPLKPLEAMALKKPVLASGVGGIRELVTHEQTGLLFRPEDEEDFRVQAARLLSSVELRKSLAEAGREFVVQQRSWKVLARRYDEIYKFCGLPSWRGTKINGPIEKPQDLYP